MDSILIIRLSALGDVAMLVPVVKALASQHPDLRITVLSAKFLRPLFEDISDNVRFVPFDKKGEHRGLKGLYRLYRQLRKEGFTYVADCHDVLRTKVLRLLFAFDNILSVFGRGAKTAVAQINKHRAGKRALVREKNKVLVQQPTSFENYAETIGQYLNLHLSLTLPPKRGGEYKVSLKNCLQESESNSKASIGIAPFAAHEGKIYPLEKSFEVLRLLLDRGCKLYLFGAGEKELAVFRDWRERLGGCENVLLPPYGEGGLKAELRLMAQLDCMITMDSGNMHLASIAGTRVVSVWGATHPLAGFLGWQQNVADCVQIDMPCRPCSIYGNKPCRFGNYPCLNRITPEDIVNKVLGET